MEKQGQRLKPRLIENLWDCPYCGNKKIRGREEKCPLCGAQREGGIEFYREEINYVDEEIAKNISRNPDWCCSFCGSLNSDTLKECTNCGAIRENNEKNYFEELEEEKKEQKEEQMIMNSYIEHPIPQAKEITGAKQMKKGVNQILKGFLSFALIGGVVAALIALFVAIFVPKEKTITIEDFSWERSISIEKMNTYNEEGWTLPTGARQSYSEERIKYYEDVIDHYETKTENVTKERVAYYEDYVSGYKDLGNGYSEEIISQRPVYETYTETVTSEVPVYKQVPVYATYYFYEIDRWEKVRSVDTSGYDQNPYWGEVVLQNKEREGHKYEEYFIHFTNEDGEKQKYSIDQNNWKTLELNQTLNVKVSFGKIVEIIGVEMIEETKEVAFFPIYEEDIYYNMPLVA